MLRVHPWTSTRFELACGRAGFVWLQLKNQPSSLKHGPSLASAIMASRLDGVLNVTSREHSRARELLDSIHLVAARNPFQLLVSSIVPAHECLRVNSWFPQNQSNLKREPARGHCSLVAPTTPPRNPAYGTRETKNSSTAYHEQVARRGR